MWGKFWRHSEGAEGKATGLHFHIIGLWLVEGHIYITPFRVSVQFKMPHRILKNLYIMS